MVHSINHSEQHISFNANPGPSSRTIGWIATFSPAASAFDGTDKPAHERAVITAVDGLIPTESPARYRFRRPGIAPCFEVDNRAAEDLVLKAEAQSGRTVGQRTPPRSLSATGM